MEIYIRHEGKGNFLKCCIAVEDFLAHFVNHKYYIGYSP
jgi:hypothetical protein